MKFKTPDQKVYEEIAKKIPKEGATFSEVAKQVSENPELLYGLLCELNASVVKLELEVQSMKAVIGVLLSKSPAIVLVDGNGKRINGNLPPEKTYKCKCGHERGEHTGEGICLKCGNKDACVWEEKL